jgi:hypothetical protein
MCQIFRCEPCALCGEYNLVEDLGWNPITQTVVCSDCEKAAPFLW